LEKDAIPNIRSLGSAEKAITVFPPITDVAYTSMVTGKTPRFTGIKKRSDSILLSQTMFQNAEKKSKSAIIIEAGIKILHDDSKTILNIDENNDGSPDDEVFYCALKKIKGNPDIILVHFHSVDDAGHKYGPDSKQAEDSIKLLDNYIGVLKQQWKGRIILTSDHGMHSIQNYGEHGLFMPEHLFIPIIYSQK
jgi:predicted AlkP superfamily pyrophosphatase or phosphodiesterase